MHYLDTSVLVAFYLPEPLNAQVQNLFGELTEVAVSGLSEVEFHSAIARRVRMGELRKDDALRVLSQFRCHVDDHLYSMVAIEQRDYMLARDWLAAFHTPLRTLDALHLAAAFASKCTIVTADKVLADSATHFGVKCRFIR